MFLTNIMSVVVMMITMVVVMMVGEIVFNVDLGAKPVPILTSI